MVAALLAGGVLDAPGAVGLGLIDLPLLGRAGVNGGGAHRCSGGCFGSLVVGARSIDAGRVGRGAAVGDGDGCLGALGKAAVRQGHGAGAGHHGLIGDRANAIRGLVADLLEHALLVGHAGPEGNVLAAQIPVVDVACGHFHRPGLAHVDRGGIQLVVNGRLSGKSADSHHTGHGQGGGHSGQFFQKRSLFHNTFSFCSR